MMRRKKEKEGAEEVVRLIISAIDIDLERGYVCKKKDWIE